MAPDIKISLIPAVRHKDGNETRYKILFKNSPSGARWRFLTNPLSAVILIALFGWHFLVAKTAIKLTWGYYYPYEGTVLKIETHWYDYVAFEFMTWEHLIIETPEGEVIDRLISVQTRIPGRIQVGDYVIKGEGVGDKVRARDKKTTQELLEELRAPGKGKGVK